MQKGKIESLVKEIQNRENLSSLRQVFELYPYLGELYYKEQQGEVVDPSEFREENFKDKKRLLLG